MDFYLVTDVTYYTILMQTLKSSKWLLKLFHIIACFVFNLPWSFFDYKGYSREHSEERVYVLYCLDYKLKNNK
jgi:hypothetical protein